jgi:hypothetical protein
MISWGFICDDIAGLLSELNLGWKRLTWRRLQHFIITSRVTEFARRVVTVLVYIKTPTTTCLADCDRHLQFNACGCSQLMIQYPYYSPLEHVHQSSYGGPNLVKHFEKCQCHRFLSISLLPRMSIHENLIFTISLNRILYIFNSKELYASVNLFAF